MTTSFRKIAATFAAVVIYCLLVAVAPQWIFRSSKSIENAGEPPIHATEREASLVFAEP
jgi:hypothetical protein